MRVTQRSMNIVICDGRATAMQRRHQAAERRAAGAVWISTETTGSMILGFLAVVLGTLNVVGGFVVTDRMLEMFKKKK